MRGEAPLTPTREWQSCSVHCSASGPGDIYRMLSIGAVVLASLAVLYRPLLFATADPEAAAARGVPARLVSTLFLLIVALAAAAGAMAMGILLAASLLIAPAAAAVRLARRPARALLLSVCLGLGVTWGGIMLAFFASRWRLPVGFTVSALAAVIYFAAGARAAKDMQAAEERLSSETAQRQGNGHRRQDHGSSSEAR